MVYLAFPNQGLFHSVIFYVNLKSNTINPKNLELSQ